MTIECYYHQCPKHSNWNEPDEGPFCYQEQCVATIPELDLYALGRSLELKGYNLEELEADNPY